jgi:D-arabinose 1-dehydrogenase-like Zn-dependent alcohol dehydrogenase
VFSPSYRTYLFNIPIPISVNFKPQPPQVNMATHRALVLKSTSEPLSLDTIPIPTATSGAVVVRVLGSYILPYLSSVVNGTFPYSLSLPMIPGANCIAHVHAVGPDSISLTPGQLVLCDITVRARDDPNLAILMGLEGSAAKKLMEGEWRDGSFAEYAKFPLENVFALDEDVLLNQLGYSIEDLCSLPGMSGVSSSPFSIFP